MAFINRDPRYKDINPSLSDWTNSLSIIEPVISGYDTMNDIAYNAQTPLSEDVVFDEALRGTAQDRHVTNQLYDLVATGNGLWGKSSAEREIEEGIKHARSINTDFSGVNSINTLQNVYNNNTIPQPLQALNPTEDNGRSMRAALAINPILEQKQRDYITGFYDQVDNINQKQLRQNMMNYFAEGGSLEELNRVTKIGAGSTHEQNPNDGVQMGIAPDNLPNLVEEGEVVYKDYVYSNRLKPSKSLLKQYNLPEKYAGKTFAELAEILQKESEDRPNDPVSLQTLEDWMSRLTSAQEEYKAKQEERRLAKAVDNMSDEEKAALMSSLVQPMAQQEGIDLSQPMYAKGGRLKEINPNDIRLGYNQPSLASQVLFNAYMKKPALQGGKLVGSNSNYSLDINGNASSGYINDYTKDNNDGTTSTYYRESDLNGNGFEKINNNSPILKQIDRINLERSIENPDYIYSPLNETIETFAKGGKIFIKPENRGKFTALKKRTGKSASWFKAHGTPAQKKMATFALNAKKWSHKHDLGGINDVVFKDLVSPDLSRSFAQYILPIDQTYTQYLPQVLTGNAINTAPGFGGINHSTTFAGEDINDTINISKPVTASDDNRGTVNTDLLAQRLGESLRYAPAVGAQLGAITAALQPKDYTLANRLEDLASEFRPMSAPHIGGYRRYTPYDVNLGDVENIGLTAAALSANRGQNRATQGALNTAVLAKAQETSAKRNLTTQQANEANRLATDTYNLGIDQFNAQRDSAYDQLNQQILANRINMLGQAAQARDASRTAWASNINSTAENAFNQLGNVGRDNWNRNQRDFLLKALGREGLLELIKLGYFKS